MAFVKVKEKLGGVEVVTMNDVSIYNLITLSSMVRG
jgi:hypothetical protein